jgi:hypothetical protein
VPENARRSPLSNPLNSKPVEKFHEVPPFVPGMALEHKFE